MRLTIFSQLVIGYLAIFILAMTVSIYAIAQLRQLENVTHSILFIDNLLIEYEKKLSDILLSMMRYEKKFIIIKDESLYDQFLLSKREFDKQLKEAMSVANTDRSSDLIIRIKQLHKHYESLINEEVNYLKSGQRYTNKSYKPKKEYAVNEIMQALKELRAFSQQDTYMKVKKLGEAAVNASKVAIVIGLVSLILGIIISIFITINITRPLSIIKNRTGEIAKGDFESDLQLSSPPEIKELAHAFNLMCAKLKEVDKLKSDFFSLMSHELRTPLTTIKEGTTLFLEGLEEGKATKKQKRLVTIINEECNRLINLVNSLLDLSKMEAGMMVYNYTQTALAPLVSKVTREIEPLAETKNIKIKADIDNELLPVKIDSDRILRVLRNLIGNAVKFTPEGGHVRVLVQNDEEGVKVSVADTGTGIARESLTAIFDKFHQVNSNKIKGTGLGLSIVKHLIDAHGGGCAFLKETERKQSAEKHLLRGQKLLSKGYFNIALKENQKVISAYIKAPPKDEALFNIGLIYAHYDNPEKDYKKTISHFTQLIKEFPQSPLVEQAKIWVNVLKIVEKKEINIVEWKSPNEHLLSSQKLLARGNYKEALKENLKVLDLPSKSFFKEEALFNIALIYAHYDNPEKDYSKSLSYFEKLINEYPQSSLAEQSKIWMGILDVIEKAKQVDIEIEQKKKELAK
jgi:two-component system sensor histidine kinase GlrK